MTNLQNKPFALVGIHVGGSDVEQTKKVMQREKLTWRTFVDAGNATAGPIARKWNLSATPTFILIDHTGVIRHKWAGPPGAKAMDAALEKLIKVAEESGKN